MDGHASNKYHRDAVDSALHFMQSIEHPSRNIDAHLNIELANTIHENRHIVKCCAESVLYCGRPKG